MAQKKADDAKVFEAAMSLAASRGWRRTSLNDIAAEAGISLGDLYERFGSKTGIVDALVRSVDKQVLEGTEPPPPEAEETARDRLFDVLMRRFDALAPYKAGLEQIAREAGGEGLYGTVCAGGRLLRSMAWMLEAADIGTAGLAGRIRVKGLAALYLSVLRTWFRDDTADQSRTMASLDRALERAERLATMQPPFGGPRRPRQEPPPGPEVGPAGP